MKRQFKLFALMANVGIFTVLTSNCSASSGSKISDSDPIKDSTSLVLKTLPKIA